MAKNKLTHLNDHLFVAMERLNEEGLDANQLRQEIERSKAVAGIAKEIINNANLVLRARMAVERDQLGFEPVPHMLTEKGSEDE